MTEPWLLLVFFLTRLEKTLKHMQRANDKAVAFVGILLNMVGEDTGDCLHDTNTYFDYIKTWTKSVDRGSLGHVTDDT